MMKPMLGLSLHDSMPTWVHDAGVWALAKSAVSPENAETTKAVRTSVRICLIIARSLSLRSGDGRIQAAVTRRLAQSFCGLDAALTSWAYLACAAIAFSICALTASRLKLAPFCIGGYSIAVWATLPTSFCTNWKRQNS